MEKRDTKPYRPLLDLRQTEQALRLIKEYFQINLSAKLKLLRVTAPLFVQAGTGVNDDLNGVERPVSFPVKALAGARVEIVQSLAKWKRMALTDYGFAAGEGLYTDMNAIRPDEMLDELHSLYVDQWDWERAIAQTDRTIEYLMATVEEIYEVIVRTERYVATLFPSITPMLPAAIFFIRAAELERRYPELTRQEREDRICREQGAVFLAGIGAPLADGRPHDGRAPDYDDWSTPSREGPGLNGDILVWNSVLERAFELSSMGIRVDAEALNRQLAATGNEARRSLLLPRRWLAGELTLAIGGGSGQSRLCMFFLRKAHIGEVQNSVWPEEMRTQLALRGIPLL